MASKLRISLMTVALFAAPVLALAQSNNPAGNMGSNRSDTAAGTNVDKTQPSTGTSDVQSRANASKPAATANDSTAPGATGKTVVPGSSSTVSGDKAGTAAAKTGQTNASGGGK